MMTDETMVPPGGPKSAFHDVGLRIGSALVLGSLSLAAVAAGGLWFAALLAVMSLALIFEWNRMVGGTGLGRVALCHGAAVLAALALGFIGAYQLAAVAVAGGAAVAFAASRRNGWAVLAPFYIGLPGLAMLWLRLAGFGGQPGGGLVYWLLISIWAMDSGAYVAGRLIGGPKLAPRFSPKKTWSGALGGVVAAVICGVIAALAAGLPDSAALGLASGVLGAWSQVGDICESAMKRRFGVKDSSGLIPGHGGFMDRLDGLLFAAPLAALAIAVGVI